MQNQKLVKRFEDLRVWQEARKLAQTTYRVTHDTHFTSDPDLGRQIRRAAVSIMANIAEGFGRYTPRDRKQFLIMARGSLAEFQNHLYIAFDQAYLTETVFQTVMGQTQLVGKLLSGFIAHLVRSQREGTNS